MCYYITATLPKKTQINLLREIFDKYNMSFSPVHNSIVESQLRLDELYFRATKSYCDCDTVLGSLNKLRDFQTLLESKKVKTLRKKKWSEEEINNWVKKKLERKEKKIGRSFIQNETKNETDRWISFIHKLLDNQMVSRIGLLKHWYTRGLENENIKIKNTQKISINGVTPDFLLNLEEDILYEFLPIYQY